jgi:hypothetical protein
VRSQHAKGIAMITAYNCFDLVRSFH